MCVHMYQGASVKVGGQLVGSGFHHVGPGDQIWVPKLGCRYLSSLGHLAGPLAASKRDVHIMCLLPRRCQSHRG